MCAITLGCIVSACSQSIDKLFAGLLLYRCCCHVTSLNRMGLQSAFGQLAVIALILTAGSLYTRHHVANIRLPDHGHSPYMEDSKAGNGTRYKVITRSADTGGHSYTVELLVRSTAPGFTYDLPGSSPAHLHQEQDETVAVKSGTLGYVLGDGGKQQLPAGQQLTVPKGTMHFLYNADNSTDLLIELTHNPAGGMGEAFFENLAGLGWAYGSADRIHPLQVLVLWDAAGATLSEYPAFLQPVIDKVLLPLARHLGFKAAWPALSSAGGLQNSSTAASSDEPEASVQREAAAGKEEL